MGLGDLDLGADRKNLYVVNLADRQLYRVPVVAPAVLGGDPTSGTPVAITMPLALPGASTGCTQSQVRPFGLHADSLGVWATLTCTGPAASNLRGYVYRYDEKTASWDAAPKLEFSLGGSRGKAYSALGSTADWRPWADAL